MSNKVVVPTGFVELPKSQAKEYSAGAMVRATHDFYKTNGGTYHMSDFSDGMTRQEFQAECDINTIMAQYERTGMITHVNRANPQYLDWTQLPDLRGRLDAYALAEEAFMSLPANVRKDFDNDPVKFVEFAQNPDNLEKMREYGLAPKAPPPKEAVEVRIVGDLPQMPPDALGEPPTTKGAGKAPK